MSEPVKTTCKTVRQKSTAQAGADVDARLRRACRQLDMPLEQVLASKLYPDRIVILFKTGQKLIWRLP